MSSPVSADITGVVLAGGLARRMGGVDKGLLTLGGRPLVAWVLEALAPQVGGLLINANRNADRYARLGYRVVADLQGDFAGPLAGVASAMAAADRPWLLTCPCDSPFVSATLAARLAEACEHGQCIAVAHDGDRLQPVFALLPIDLRADLEAFLAAGERKIDKWFARHDMRAVDFSDAREMFRNLNTPDDLAEASRELAA